MNKKEWTIMLYMAGDNNLAANMAYAMGQLKEFANEANGRLNLFVYYDGNSPSMPTLYCDFSGKEAEYYRSHKIADKPFRVTENRINENAADPNSILNFVDWCVNKQSGRAERYAFILSGHSLGFLGEGLFRDETSGKSMNLGDLMYAVDRMTSDQEFLSNVKANPSDFNVNPWGDDKFTERFLLGENADELLGRRLDILGFDSCVMGMFEVGSQFKHCAKTMIVSEGSIPSAGWTYAKLLRDLCESTDKTTEDLAAGLVENYIKGQSEFVIGGVSVDMAAWNMDKFIELQVAVGALSSNLLKCFESGSPLYLPMERAILKVHWKCQSYMYEQNVDLGDFCELLLQECDCIENELGSGAHDQLLSDLKWGCKDILQALQEVVIQSGFSGGRCQYSNGVSIFFPWSLEAYEAAEQDYKSLWATTEATGFSQTTAGSLLPWGDFLKKYLGEVSRRKYENYTESPLPGKKIRNSSPFRFSDGLHASTQDSKLAGTQDSKLAGTQDSKLAGTQDSKLAGTQDSKLAGTQDSKLAGTQDSKMGGGSSNLLFDSLKLWKNVEAHQDIYGFTRASETEAADHIPVLERARPMFFPPSHPMIEQPRIIAVTSNAEEDVALNAVEET
ncbi:MAG: clostripain-related cysteine peptidase [Acidobacteriota bacterium]|nr:clostripain-related cysteine peptidase [Acidobacteriota bacterium]